MTLARLPAFFSLFFALIFACAPRAPVCCGQSVWAARHPVAPDHPPRPACKGLAGGGDVDWWIILKFPRGYSFVYLDAAQLAECSASPSELCWSGPHSLLQPLGLTLAAATDASSAVLFYNDEDPGGGEHFTYAHAKGVLVAGQHGGFWLQHSAPRYPRPPDTPDFATLEQPQSVYGQHFACMSLPAAGIEAVAQSLAITRPHVYVHALPPSLAAAYPQLAKLMSGDWDPHATHAATHLNTSTWSAPLPAMLVAKGPHYALPFHERILEPVLHAGMAWETWRLGVGALASQCPPVSAYPSLNVDAVRVRDLPAAAAARGMLPTARTGAPSARATKRTEFPSTLAAASPAWPWTEDHSKWGVSLDCPRLAAGHGADVTPPVSGCFVCMCDLNREASQAYRGGGCVCLNGGKPLWRAFRSLVAALEPCLASSASGNVTELSSAV